MEGIQSNTSTVFADIIISLGIKDFNESKFNFNFFGWHFDISNPTIKEIQLQVNKVLYIKFHNVFW